MTLNRSYSAPPVDKFFSGDDIELKEIEYVLNYSTYYRKNKDPRLDPPKFIFEGQSSYWACEHNDFILRAFSEKRTGVEMIDFDHPDSESCSEFSGRSRTTTPVGDKSVILPELVQKLSTTMLIPVSVSSMQKIETNTVMAEIKPFYETICADVSFDSKVICINVCKDQEGSRFIQGKIDSWETGQISFFFMQIVGSALELSTNLFGNYVIQKIIPFLSEEESFKLILQFFGEIYELSLHVYGCRVVQKLIDNLDDIKFIVAELESHIVDLIASPNGNHVIQKCIDKDIEKGFLLREFEKDCIALAQQRYGCRVLQRLFEVCKEEETWSIYLEIISSINVLINDKYGNYVIQHLIQSENKKKEEIFDFIIKNCFELSKFKFSSNVIEKCVNNASKTQLEALLEQFSRTGENKKPYLFYMCTDMYANYVVQRFFDMADNDMKNKAKMIIKPYLKEMRLIPFTKHILARLS